MKSLALRAWSALEKLASLKESPAGRRDWRRATIDGEGNVILTGKTFTTDFSDAVKHWGKVIDPPR